MAGGGWPLLGTAAASRRGDALRVGLPRREEPGQGCAARCSCQRDFILRRDAAPIDWTPAGCAPACPVPPMQRKDTLVDRESETGSREQSLLQERPAVPEMSVKLSRRPVTFDVETRRLVCPVFQGGRVLMKMINRSMAGPSVRQRQDPGGRHL
jgi:hypothetical protein